MNTIEAAGLTKSFVAVRALNGFDLTVSRGSICALLGPNGAGKTTAIRILATLTRRDAGRASVAGYDVVRQPGLVRGCIGLAGQHAAVDDDLTGRENLFILGLMHHLGRRGAHQRAAGLLAEFGLADAADRLVKTWSGGMRRWPPRPTARGLWSTRSLPPWRGPYSCWPSSSPCAPPATPAGESS